MIFSINNIPGICGFYQAILYRKKKFFVVGLFLTPRVNRACRVKSVNPIIMENNAKKQPKTVAV